MKPSLPVTVAALAASAVALPVVAQADHKPNHQGGGGAGNLTLTAKPTTTVFRNATVLSGTLKGNNNAGATVRLRQDEFPYGTDVTDVATTKTDANGNYSFTRRPVRNTNYRAVVGNTVSDNALVNVRIRIGLRFSDYSPFVGQLVRFRGRACPAHDGLVVLLKRKTPSGSFRTVRRARLKAADTCSVYSRLFRVFRDGKYRVVADDADHARGFSPTRFINVHR